MKILQLNLHAFGSFTNNVLDFSGGDKGLHIVYGSNEAGKTTALWGLRYMLFGFPDRTPYNFIHPYPRLRIGGILCKSNGTKLEFIRRKGKLNTLRSPDDTTLIDESELSDFLGGVNESLFKTMFGIDHARLVRGGKEIIAGGGDVGQILFAGGSGISDFQKVQNDLQDEAEKLFKPSGKIPRINDAILNFNKKHAEIRDVQLSGQEWVRHDSALHSAIKEKQSKDADLEQKLIERNRLERIKAALPAVSSKKELSAHLLPYADAVILSDDFSERRRDAVTQLRIAENEEKEAVSNIEEINHQLEKIEIPETLLEKGKLIDTFHRELGSIQKAAQDRPRLMGRKTILEAEANEILRELRNDLTLEQTEELRLKKAEKVNIRELGILFERLNSKQKNTTEEISKLSSRINGLKKQIAEIEAPHEIGELRQVIENAQKHGNLEAQYQAVSSEIQKTEATAAIALKKFPLWKGSLEEIERLPVPSLESVERFEYDMGEAGGSVTTLVKEISRIEDELLKINSQIEQLQLEQAVPAESDLYEARQQREKEWHQIRENVFPPANGVAKAYEAQVRYADEIADRLRREADRVAKKASFFAERDIRKSQYEKLRLQLKSAEKEFDEIRREWDELWDIIGINPKTPKEMRRWIRQQADLANQAAGIREQKVKASDMQTFIEMLRQEFFRAISPMIQNPNIEEESLGNLLENSKRLVSRMEKIQGNREKFQSELIQRAGELREAEIRLEGIHEELSRWRYDWEKAVRKLGLDADATPEQANAVTDDLENLFGKLRDAHHDELRIKSIDRDASAFKEKIRQFAEQNTPDLLHLPEDQMITEINARLVRGQTAKAKQEDLEKRKEKEQARLSKARSKIAEIRSLLSVMCEEAKCRQYEELPEAEARSARCKKIQTELSHIEKELRKLSGGHTLEKFIQDIQDVDSDTIEPLLYRLNEAIEQLGQQKSLLDQTIGSERTELARMDGSAKAAELAEEAQHILAAMEADAEQYVRLRLASAVLNQAIERYREKNQGPILTRANELFAHMTLGAFEGLRLDFNENGDAFVVGVRSGSRDIVHVEGMSDGTADQLYLAIRLASLEAYMKKNEAMPFIVDDILIKFDDERSAATLEILSQLSDKTQIIFFTHHQHLLELAAARIDNDRLFTHFLKK